jgi:hypothetical protein
MSDNPKDKIGVMCPKCKAIVILEIRDDEHLGRKGYSVPSDCEVVKERIIQEGHAVTDPSCPILEREKARVVSEWRKSHVKTR